MSWLIPAMIAKLSSLFVLTLLYWYIFLQYRERYVKIWAIGWSAYSVEAVFQFLELFQGRLQVVVGHELLALLSGLLLLLGTLDFLDKPAQKKIALFLLVYTAWVDAVYRLKLPVFFLHLPGYVLQSVIFIWTGINFWRFGGFRGLGRRILGGAFILWGFHKLNYLILLEIPGFLPWFHLISTVFVITIAIGIVIFYFDKARRDIGKSRDFYLNLFNEFPYLMWCTNIDGKLDFLNKSFMDFLGRTTAETVQNDWAELIHPEDMENFTRVYPEAHKNRKRLSLEYRLKRCDGECRWVIGTIMPFNGLDGNYAGCVGLCIDITERKKVEAALQEAGEKAERAMRTVSLAAMASAIAHEINQPLNSIKVISDSILFWHKQGKWPSQQEIAGKLKKISDQAQRISDITRHMRSVIRRDDSPDEGLCDMNNAVNEALEMLGHRLKKGGIRVVKDFVDPPPHIMGHNNMIEEVAINLMTNAIQAFAGSGREFREINCTTLVGQTVVLEISDNATGIEEEQLETIFEPFFTGQPGKGTGLGLFVVRSIVTSLKGQISVTNNDRGGATFRIEFPRVLNETGFGGAEDENITRGR